MRGFHRTSIFGFVHEEKCLIIYVYSPPSSSSLSSEACDCYAIALNTREEQEIFAQNLYKIFFRVSPLTFSVKSKDSETIFNITTNDGSLHLSIDDYTETLKGEEMQQFYSFAMDILDYLQSPESMKPHLLIHCYQNLKEYNFISIRVRESSYALFDFSFGTSGVYGSGLVTECACQNISKEKKEKFLEFLRLLMETISNKEVKSIILSNEFLTVEYNAEKGTLTLLKFSQKMEWNDLPKFEKYLRRFLDSN